MLPEIDKRLTLNAERIIGCPLIFLENLLEKADRLKPNTPEILFSLGETYRLLKKDVEAKSAYRRAMELNPIYKVGAFSPSRYYPELRDW